MPRAGARKKAEQLIDAAEQTLVDQEFVLARGELKRLERHPAYIVTCAQNNTPIVKPLWEAIKRYAEHHNARILVIPVRYKNPTNRRDPKEGNKDRPDYWWPEELHPYMVENRVRLHSRVVVMGDVRVDATADNPLAGFEAISGEKSALFGHAQLRMECIPTPQQSLPKILHTTGSVSQKNYSQTKAGARAEFHHTNGALVVHKRQGRYHLRHLAWCDDSECFYDLNERWTPAGLEDAGRVPALVLGDEHAPFTDPSVVEATFGRDGLVSLLRPREIVRHDVFDGFSISHWDKKNPLALFAKMHHGLDLKTELDAVLAYINATTPGDSRTIVVPSNHNERLLRWLKDHDPRKNVRDNAVYHRLMAAMQERVGVSGSGVIMPDPFAVWCEISEHLTASALFLDRGEPHQIEGVEVGFHGDRGVKGTRGTRGGYAKIGVKTVIGHSHSPGILKGCFQIGCSFPLDFSYMRGAPTDIMHTHCVIHANGKRQLVNIVKGSYR
jgi:hypothetical protein